MRPFVYRLTSKNGEFYYGCRYSQDCSPEDLWASYFTSSDVVKGLIEEHGTQYFTTKIVFECETPDQALHLERNLIARTHKRPGCLNQFLCRKDGTPVHFGTYGNHTEETKMKISVSNKGRKRSQEMRDNISKGKTGRPWTEKQRNSIQQFKNTPKYNETRRKIVETSRRRTKTPEELKAISEKLTGIKRSEETRRRMSDGAKLYQRQIPLYKRPRALKLKPVWGLAEQCYQYFVTTGKGYHAFSYSVGLQSNIGVFRSMYKLFKDGWIPNQDKEFIEYMK